MAADRQILQKLYSVTDKREYLRIIRNFIEQPFLARSKVTGIRKHISHFLYCYFIPLPRLWSESRWLMHNTENRKAAELFANMIYQLTDR
jgi:hypothetical protein